MFGTVFEKWRRVDYIVNNHTAWIDTGYMGTGGCMMECVLAKDTDNGEFIFGSHNNADIQNYEYERNIIDTKGVRSNAWFHMNKQGDYTEENEYNTVIVTGKKYTARMDNRGVYHICYLNGIKYIDRNNGHVLNPTNDVAFSYAHYDNSCIKGGRLYAAKIWDKDGVLVRDFIPVVQNDGKAGLLDLVNKKFYGSMTNDNFNYGELK